MLNRRNHVVLLQYVSLPSAGDPQYSTGCGTGAERLQAVYWEQRHHHERARMPHPAPFSPAPRPRGTARLRTSPVSPERARDQAREAQGCRAPQPPPGAGRAAAGRGRPRPPHHAPREHSTTLGCYWEASSAPLSFVGQRHFGPSKLPMRSDRSSNRCMEWSNQVN